MISLSKYATKIQKSAKSVEEAKELVLAELGLTEDEVEISTIEEGTKGFLGLGSKEAVIEVTVKNADSYRAKVFLKQIFEDMNIDVNIDVTSEGNDLNIDLSGDNMGIIIGKRGDTLDSLQYLTSLVVNHKRDEYCKVTIDTENYREKRYTALIALAERLADKVIRTGKKYTLEPMNPYERRIIHSTLQAKDEVTTFSIGEDPYRKVVIALKNAPSKTTYHKKPLLSNYPHPKKQPSYENFESYIKDNELSDDE